MPHGGGLATPLPHRLSLARPALSPLHSHRPPPHQPPSQTPITAKAPSSARALRPCVPARVSRGRQKEREEALPGAPLLAGTRRLSGTARRPSTEKPENAVLQPSHAHPLGPRTRRQRRRRPRPCARRHDAAAPRINVLGRRPPPPQQQRGLASAASTARRAFVAASASTLWAQARVAASGAPRAAPTTRSG